jgi:hypothetical protein
MPRYDAAIYMIVTFYSSIALPTCAQVIRGKVSHLLIFYCSLFICLQGLGKTATMEQGERLLRGEETISAKRRGSTSD